MSVNGDITEELRQREVNEIYAREKIAKDLIGDADEVVDKLDINYWYNLKEKGAITDSEYEKKKKELLK